MKILQADVGALNNFEVLEFLKSKGASKKPEVRSTSAVPPSEYKVFDYLANTPADTQTRESIDEFKEKCKQYHLGDEKILNIINTRPAQVVEIYAIIEENADELIEIVADVFTMETEASTMETVWDAMNVEGNEKNDGNEEKPENGEAPMEAG